MYLLIRSDPRSLRPFLPLISFSNNLTVQKSTSKTWKNQECVCMPWTFRLSLGKQLLWGMPTCSWTHGVYRQEIMMLYGRAKRLFFGACCPKAALEPTANNTVSITTGQKGQAQLLWPTINQTQRRKKGYKVLVQVHTFFSFSLQVLVFSRANKHKHPYAEVQTNSSPVSKPRLAVLYTCASLHEREKKSKCLQHWCQQAGWKQCVFLASAEAISSFLQHWLPALKKQWACWWTIFPVLVDRAWIQ